MNLKKIVVTLVLGYGLLLSGCGPDQFLDPTLTPAFTQTPTPSPTPSPRFDQWVELKLLAGIEDTSARGLDWSSDGKLLAVAGGYDRKLHIWDVLQEKSVTIIEGHNRYFVGDVAWSRDNTLVVTAGMDSWVRKWDTETWEQLPALSNYTTCLSWSPDGSWLAGGGIDIRIWNTETWKLQKKIKGHSNLIEDLDWSPDGSKLVSSSYDTTVRIWEFDSGKLLFDTDDHAAPVWGVDWSPDGNRIASCGNDIRIWDATSGKQLLILLPDHPRSIRAVSWSPNSRWLASVGDDGLVRIWDSNDWKQIALLEGHTDIIYGVAWSPDGRQLATTSGDGTVRIWGIAK